MCNQLIAFHVFPNVCFDLLPFVFCHARARQTLTHTRVVGSLFARPLVKLLSRLHTHWLSCFVVRTPRSHRRWPVTRITQQNNNDKPHTFNRLPPSAPLVRSGYPILVLATVVVVVVVGLSFCSDYPFTLSRCARLAPAAAVRVRQRRAPARLRAPLGCAQTPAHRVARRSRPTWRAIVRLHWQSAHHSISCHCANSACRLPLAACYRSLIFGPQPCLVLAPRDAASATLGASNSHPVSLVRLLIIDIYSLTDDSY